MSEADKGERVEFINKYIEKELSYYEGLLKKMENDSVVSWDKLNKVFADNLIMDDRNLLLLNLSKVHTTEMGVDRIKKNLGIDVDDVVDWCKTKISDRSCQITRKGKNWYVKMGQQMLVKIGLILENIKSYLMKWEGKQQPAQEK